MLKCGDCAGGVIGGAIGAYGGAAITVPTLGAGAVSIYLFGRLGEAIGAALTSSIAESCGGYSHPYYVQNYSGGLKNDERYFNSTIIINGENKSWMDSIGVYHNLVFANRFPEISASLRSGYNDDALKSVIDICLDEISQQMNVTISLTPKGYEAFLRLMRNVPQVMSAWERNQQMDRSEYIALLVNSSKALGYETLMGGSIDYRRVQEDLEIQYEMLGALQGMKREEVVIFSRKLSEQINATIQSKENKRRVSSLSQICINTYLLWLNDK